MQVDPSRARAAVIVVDLGYGDQGKGTITDYLVRTRGAHTVVRYNGGAQAGHNVVTADGRHHTFAQFGAGSFVPGVATVLTAGVAIQPWAMVVEAQHLVRAGVSDAFARTLIAEDCVVITPFHGAAVRLRERARGAHRHGSTGVGVGDAVWDARTLTTDYVVRARDLADTRTFAATLRRVQARKREELAEALRLLDGDVTAEDDRALLDDPAMVDLYVQHLAPFTSQARVVGDDRIGAVLSQPGTVIFEGAQGVLLDEWRGFHPYTTWSPCTDHPALAVLAAHGWQGNTEHLGVVRAYATRHGAGPLVTEDVGLTAAIPDVHNTTHPWQGSFRVGWFDAVATRYAIRACERVDALAVTCLDRLRTVAPWRLANACTVDGHTVTDIPLGPPEDIAYTARWTERLLRAHPVYSVTTDRGDTVEHLRAIGKACGVPVTLASDGPTADDKWAVGENYQRVSSVQRRGGRFQPS